MVPYTESTPPAGMIETLLQGQVPWVFEITGKMARIKITKTEIKSMGSGLYRVKAWVENTGFLPYPTAMGQRNNRNLPVIVTLSGKNITILEGKKRSLIKAINGHQSQLISWLIHTEKPDKLDIEAATATAWKDKKIIDLGDAK